MTGRMILDLRETAAMTVSSCVRDTVVIALPSVDCASIHISIHVCMLTVLVVIFTPRYGISCHEIEFDF